MQLWEANRLYEHTEEVWTIFFFASKPKALAKQDNWPAHMVDWLLKKFLARMAPWEGMWIQKTSDFWSYYFENSFGNNIGSKCIPWGFHLHLQGSCGAFSIFVKSDTAGRLKEALRPRGGLGGITKGKEAMGTPDSQDANCTGRSRTTKVMGGDDQCSVSTLANPCFLP